MIYFAFWSWVAPEWEFTDYRWYKYILPILMGLWFFGATFALPNWAWQKLRE